MLSLETRASLIDDQMVMPSARDPEPEQAIAQEFHQARQLAAEATGDWKTGDDSTAERHYAEILNTTFEDWKRS